MVQAFFLTVVPRVAIYASSWDHAVLRGDCKLQMNINSLAVEQQLEL